MFFTVVKDNEATNNNVEISWNSLKATIYEQYKKSRKAAGGGNQKTCSLLTYLHNYILSYLVTYLLTPWSRVFLEQLTSSQLVKKFPAFYGTPKLMTVFTSARHLSLSWHSSIQSTPQHPTSWRSILILSSHLRLGLPSCLFPSGHALYSVRFEFVNALSIQITDFCCMMHCRVVQIHRRFGEKYRLHLWRFLRNVSRFGL